jgi:hypothetical protein
MKKQAYYQKKVGWLVIFKTKTLEVSNLKSFCKRRKISYWRLYYTQRAKNPGYRGMKLEKVNLCS